MIKIKRLQFRLPDFTRYSWVSDQARMVWEPRIRQILEAWTEIEWQSVAAGLRQCTLQMASPEQFADLSAKMAKHGLAVLPLSMQAASSQPYSNTASVYQPGKPFNYQIVIGTLDNVVRFKAAYDANDQNEIGQLMGYPTCCRSFFQKIWVEEQYIDTTWPMACNTAEPSVDEALIEVNGPPGTNILLRWLGIRAVPHLPCAFNCQDTVDKAQQYLTLGIEAGYAIEMIWLIEMLSWPVEWSALHGIAEIKTPVVKISSCTDATPIKYVVRRRSNVYPEESARGLIFPYQKTMHRHTTDSKSFKQDLTNPISGANSKTKPDWHHIDNGFMSEFEMNVAHKPIVELVTSTLANNAGAVLDLGCGNGILLKKIIAANEHLIPYGIEKDPEKIAHAHYILPDHTANFVIGDIFEIEDFWANEQKYALTILMPGRLLEASPDQARRLKQRIKYYSSILLVYAYGDWLTNHGSLTDLAKKTGLRLVNPQANITTSLAKIL